MKSSITVDKNGVEFNIGAVAFCFSKEEIFMLERWCKGGKGRFILKSHLIEDKAVEVMNIKGKTFTKSDIEKVLFDSGAYHAMEPNIFDEVPK